MAYATIRRGASKDGYFAVPEEGSSFFISFTQAAQLGIHEGQELDEIKFDTLRMKMLGSRCRLKAMDALARREHGRKELELKLRQKDFPPDVIGEQLDRLEAEHLLSDRRFATQYVDSRQRRNPEGRNLLTMRLMQRGVDRSLAEQVVDTWFSDFEAAQDAISRAASKIICRYPDDRDRLRADLFKKGFSHSEISIFLEDHFNS